jgi:hypothetical protein
MRSALILASMLAIGAPAVASAAPPAANLEHRESTAMVDLFFSKLKSGPAGEAYRAIWAGTLMDKKAGQLQVIADQTDSVLRYYGPITGWELLREGPSSAHFQERTYILRTEGGPLVFRFHLFDNGTRWTISKLTFNDDYDKLSSTPTLQ